MCYKILSLLILIISLFACTKKSISEELIYSITTFPSAPLIAVKNGEFLISFYSGSSEGAEKRTLYRYDNKKLIELNVFEADEEEPYGNYYHEKYKINDKKFIILKGYKVQGWYELYLVDDGKEIRIADEYIVLGLPNYTLYFDETTEKLYFIAKKLKDSDAMDEFPGFESKFYSLYTYDVKQNQLDILMIGSKDNDYLLPIRVPNTPLLLYLSTSDNAQKQYTEEDEENDRKNGVSLSEIQEKRSRDNKAVYEKGVTLKVWIKEIPEWKAEIEQQEKNIKKYPKAKQYFIDGPAVIRNNPKGETISTLNDWTRVLVLNQQGDWYEVLYADVKGWTYKDNLRLK
jgi:hypothetical protein